MLPSKKRWKIQSYDSEEVDKIAGDFNLDPLIAKILSIRGINDKKKINGFFNIDERSFYDPYIFNDMRKAVDRIQLAIIKNEKLLIYGDYDADGVTSTALLYRTLSRLGADCSFDIPNRFTDGYGINNEAIRRAYENDVRVIITVDTGISAIEGAELAKSFGISLIITDHHEPQATLPDAYAIINPKTPDEAYPFKNLAGVGVAFKLVHALLDRVPYEYMDLVALGTIADLVPLVDENRAIATIGLQQMKSTVNIGIQALLNKTGLKDKQLSSYHIGFIIGPRINAIGRLESSHTAVQLLITENTEEAKKIAEQLESINRERQSLVKVITEEALQIIQEHNMENDRVLIVAKENWNVGVIGIVASHILKKYYRPTIVLSIDLESGIAKGSARSINGFNMYDALTESENILHTYGGHPSAAGLSLDVDNILILRDELNTLASKWLNDEDMIPFENVDVVSNLKEINIDLIKKLDKLGPFGIGNPHPIILIDDARVINSSTLGNQNQHLKINVKNDGEDIEAIYFNNGQLSNEIANLSNIKLLGELNINEWKGNKKPQIILRDIKIDDIQIFDLRDSQKEKLDELYRGKSIDMAIFYNYEIKDKMKKEGWNYISYKDGQNIEGYDLKSIILIHLPPSIQMLKRILSSLPNIERIYCIFENHDKWLSKIDINRELFKKFYITLLTNDSLRNTNSIERYYEKYDINADLCKFMIEVFLELELISISDDEIQIISNNGKTDLNQSSIFQEYKKEEEVKTILLYSNSYMFNEWFQNHFC